MAHNYAQAEDDGITDDSESVDFGCDSETGILRELEERVNEATEEWLPVCNIGALKQLLKEHIAVFRLKLESEVPPKTTAVKIILDSKAKPVRVKVRRDQTYHNKRMATFSNGSVPYGYVRPSPNASW